MQPYYQDSHTTLYHGDCRDIVPALPPGLVTITDPPYLQGDFSWLLDLVGRPLVVTPGKLQAVRWIQKAAPDWIYAWRGSSRSKGGRACLHIGFEPLLAYGFPYKPLGNDVLDFPINSDPGLQSKIPRVHPWAKPEQLLRKLVYHWTKPAATVLDPFAGSGTTLRAAKQLGRRAIGIERDERYCADAAERLAATRVEEAA